MSILYEGNHRWTRNQWVRVWSSSSDSCCRPTNGLVCHGSYVRKIWSENAKSPQTWQKIDSRCTWSLIINFTRGNEKDGIMENSCGWSWSNGNDVKYDGPRGKKSRRIFHQNWYGTGRIWRIFDVLHVERFRSSNDHVAVHGVDEKRDVKSIWHLNLIVNKFI